MKTILASALVATATFAGAASAMTNAPAGDLATITHYAPSVDVTRLTDKDVNILLSAIHSSDSESEKRGFISAYLK